MDRHNMIFIAPMYTCLMVRLNFTHTHNATVHLCTCTQKHRHTCRCPHAFHEVTCYAVGVSIGPVCTCAWQDMYVHSTLEC